VLPCTFQLLTPIPIRRKEFGKQLFALILKYFPSHVPRLYGEIEPLRRRFDAKQIDVALESWGKDSLFMTQGQESEVSMMVSFENSQESECHSSIAYFDFPLAGADELPSLKMLLIELSQAFFADYAMAHILTQHELNARLFQIGQRVTSWPSPPADRIVSMLRERIDREGYRKVLWGQEASYINTAYLSKSLPNLFWLNVFGSPYIGLFGLNKLMGAPCESVEKLRYGGVALMLASSLADEADAWNSFHAVREKCKEHLGVSVFRDPNRPKAFPYTTPRFEFGAPLGRH
jgi:hypothetical protein